jgi:hypothetical protein
MVVDPAEASSIGTRSATDIEDSPAGQLFGPRITEGLRWVRARLVGGRGGRGVERCERRLVRLRGSDREAVSETEGLTVMEASKTKSVTSGRTGAAAL